jgi:DNA mismatch repair ATPase MutS
MYFEQAEELAPLLNLKLASKRTSAGPVPMAGFPFFQLDRFLKILVRDLSKHVAISEEFANNSEDRARSGSLMFDRKVSRVVTPGTLIDEKFMDASENNFILFVHLDPDGLGKGWKGQENVLPGAHLLSAPQRVGLSWMDLSTGDFFTQLTSTQMLPSAIARIGAREIVVSQSLKDQVGQELRMLVGQDRHLLSFFDGPNDIVPMSGWTSMLEAPISLEAQSLFSKEEVAASYSLLEYVRTQLQGISMKLQPPRRRHLDESMNIDRNSLRGLEILETSRDGLGKGSLLHAVRRTSTASGARLLRDRLSMFSCFPLKCITRLLLLFICIGELKTSKLHRRHQYLSLMNAWTSFLSSSKMKTFAIISSYY